MNYKVLYRKYRPTNFDEIIGQNNTVALLKECIANDKISHAYIFSGPRGTGKTSSAKIFAKAVNCPNAKDGNPCNKCEYCECFTGNNDVYEIDAASNNGVEQVRELIDNIKLAPINSKYKVYIIDEVHMLSTSAFNALLLTLEEPPSHVIFILATTDIENVPITVLSRCQRMDFKRVSANEIINLLKDIAKKEKISIEDDAIKEIAEYSDGGVRDSLSILDQLSKSNTKIDVQTVLDSLGTISNQKMEELIDNIDKNNIDAVMEFIELSSKNAVDFKSLIKRIITVIKKRAIEIKKNNTSYRLSYDQMKQLAIELANLVVKNTISINQFALLELTLIGYIDNQELGNISQEIKSTKKIEKVEEEPVEETYKEVKEDRNPQLESTISNLSKIRINNCFINANKKFLEQAKGLWNEFIEKTTVKKVKALTLDFDVVLASDEIIILKNDFQDKVDKLNDQINYLENQFNKLVNTNYRIAGVNTEDWNQETENYKENKKNKIEYKYIEEDTPQIDGEIVDIFENDVIEIKEG